MNGTRPPRLGSLVVVHRHPSNRSSAGDELSKGYDSPPNEHGFHRALWVMPGVGIVVERKENYSRVLIHERYVWFEDHQLDLLRR
jgi:hypothetical protein